MDADKKVLIPERLYGEDKDLDVEELQERAQKALLLRGAGFSNKEAAANVGLDVGTVRVLSRRNQKTIGDVREVIKQRTQDFALEHLDELNQALLHDVLSAESRTRPQSYKAMMEAAGVVGKAQDIHIGDNFNQLHLDQSTHQTIMTRLPEERAKRRRELEERFGLAP